jgi:hypothetical protein
LVMKKFYKTFFWAMALSCPVFSFGQNVGIGTSTPNASAKLDIVDVNRGILLPRVALTATNVQAPVTSPANWLVVFNTNVSAPGAFAVSEGLYYWDGTLLRWVRIGSAAASSNDWALLGNASTVASTNFIGTTDTVDFVTRTNNTEKMRVTSAGNVGVGTTTPATSLSVNGATTIGAAYAGTAANAAPTNGLRVQGRTVINKANGQDTRDILSVHTSATAFSSVTGYASVTAARAIAGYADANGMGVFGYANRAGYGVVGLTQTGILSNFIQGGEGVLGQADGATGATGIPIGVHGILDESIAGMRAATPVLGENNNITRGNGFTGGAYATVTAQSVAGVYGNIGSRGAVAGDNGYMFGVIGDILVVSGTVPDGSGGVLGSSGSGSFGMLGYKGLTSTVYSVYGGGQAGSTAASNTGNRSSAPATPTPNNHIGLGIVGGFMGGYVKGNQYGLLSRGEEFGMYVQGKTIVNQPIVQLTAVPQSNDRIVSYAPTSTQVDVTTRGTSALNNGQIFVAFDDKFRKLINPNEPIIINITPKAETKGVFVSQVTAQGFYVRENMQGTSNAAFYWTATGTKNGFETGVTISNTILNNNFDDNINGVMLNEGEASSNGTEPLPVYFDGQNVLFQNIPARFLQNQQKINPAQPATNTRNSNTH